MVQKEIFYTSKVGFFEVTINKNIGIYAIIAIIAIIAVIIKSKLLYKRLEHKPININIYQRDLPSNLRPAHVRLLLNDGLIDEKSLVSTIVDLIDKGYLEIRRGEKEVEDKTDLFRNREISLYKTNKSTKELLRYEKFVIDWFIEKYGDGKQVSSRCCNGKFTKNYI